MAKAWAWAAAEEQTTRPRRRRLMYFDAASGDTCAPLPSAAQRSRRRGHLVAQLGNVACEAKLKLRTIEQRAGGDGVCAIGARGLSAVVGPVFVN